MINNYAATATLAPGVAIGNYRALLEGGCSPKVIVNCGLTERFLEFLDTSQPVISSDVIVLSLDPSTMPSDKAYTKFHARYHRVLQNYLAFFYSYNADASYYVHANYQNGPLSFELPILSGNPLRLLFNVNRLIRLICNVNRLAGVLLVSENFGTNHRGNALLHALALLYLMDNYGYNYEASVRALLSMVPAGPLLSSHHYDDILLIDSLKKFYRENIEIKQSLRGVMTKNYALKRSLESVDMGPVKRHTK